jgi:hypothetical protein
MVAVAERVASMPQFDGLLLLGSFASGHADQISDVDLVAVVAAGEFQQAWQRRGELEPPGALVAWDLFTGEDGDAGSHKWITAEIVKVECAIVDPGNSAMQLAEPYAVLLGEPTLGTRFAPLEPIPPDVLEQYAQRLRDLGLVPEVETRYGELRDALRRAQQQ